MTTIEIDPQNLAAATRAIPENTPIVMLNLLRYKEQGREVYFQRYVPAFQAIAARSESTRSIAPLFLGSVLSHLVGPADEQWHDVALVEYPNFASFLSIVESPDYQRDAAPHRRAALENWRLIAMLKQPLS